MDLDQPPERRLPASRPAGSRPAATLSLDLDNRWSYLKTHGDPAWRTFPSYLELVVPRVLGLLGERKLRITVFVVGQDAARAENREPLQAIARAGHEIGNHSFHHEPWLHLYSPLEIEEELARAEEEIERATGRRPLGFRGPGFSVSAATLRCLVRRGYLYDASTFPTFLGPLARAYYFATARLSKEEKLRRKALFGGLSDGLRPLRPYRWRLEEGALLEIPVTTLPFLKTPIHASYVLYLSVHSPALARLYFRAALGLCRLAGVAPSLLLHPLDFLGREDAPDLSFFPAMGLPARQKLELMAEVLDLFAGRFETRTLEEAAREAAARPDLEWVEPRFRAAPPVPVAREDRGAVPARE